MRTPSLIASVALATAAAATAALTLTGTAAAGHTNQVLEASLDGREEVGAGASDKRVLGDPNGTGSIYVFGVDGDPRTLCYVLTVDGIDQARAAHLHEAREGANGPVVVNLAAPADGNAADCLTEGETTPSGAPAFNGTTAQEVLANPGDYYANVHNAAYPGGALRGQLAAER